MKKAYTLLGLLFAIIILGAWYAFDNPVEKDGDIGNITKINGSAMKAETGAASSVLEFRSPAFANNAAIPSKYTCDRPAQAGGSRDINPPLSISNVPAATKSLALIMDDPDVPKQLRPDGVFDHWIVFNIPPPAKNTTLEIQEGGPIPGVEGANGAGKNSYTGPCPPPQYEPSEHRYFFKLYALDEELPLRAGATKQEVEQAMKGHILEEAQLIGRYKRK